jgi:hypothetical protein
MDDRLDGRTATVQRGISGCDWLPANDLIKVVAMILMVIDHVAWAFSRHPDVWRALGRGSFPLFAALLVVGMRRTRDPRRYLMRLTLFALISQYPFALCFEGLNIGFTLAVGGLALYAGEDFLERNRQAGHPLRGWLGWSAAMGAAGIVTSLLQMDYGGMGIVAMALLQRSPTARVGIPLMMGWTALFAWLRNWWAAYWGALVVGAALLLGWALRGWKRRFLRRWIVYAFYPVHLTIIGLVLATSSPEPAEEPAILTVPEDARPLRENPPVHRSVTLAPVTWCGVLGTLNDRSADRRVPMRGSCRRNGLDRTRRCPRQYLSLEADAGVAGMWSVLVFLPFDS